MADMRKQIEAEVGRRAAKLGLPSDEAQTKEIVHGAEEMYDSLMDKKLTELEAYRQVMRELDVIEDKLRAERAERAEVTEKEEPPKTESRAAYDDKKMKRLAGKLNAIMWLATPALYVLLSSTFGGWGKWWLLFLSSSIGSIILDMLCDWNRGVPLSRMKGNFNGIMWLGAVIAFFLIGFTFGWKLSWIIFIVATIISVILSGDEDENNK